MSELNEKARALIRSTQFADEPSQADYDRVHSAVEARIALGIVAGAVVTVAAESAAASTAVATTGAAASTVTMATGTAAAVTATGVGVGGTVAPAATALGTALLAKVAAWVVVVGTVAVGTTVAIRHDARVGEPVQVFAIPAASPALKDALGEGRERREGSPEVAVPMPTPEPIAVPAAPTPPSLEAPLEARKDSPTKSSVGLSGAGLRTTAPVSVEPSGLDAEIALLRDARDALRRGQPDQALAVVEDHARRFPRGALAEEGDAERVLCLCALGRLAEARSREALFVADYPHSSYLASLKGSCAGADTHR